METMTCVRHDSSDSCGIPQPSMGCREEEPSRLLQPRFVAGELENQSFAEIARAMGAEGITVDKLEDVGPTCKKPSTCK